MARKKTSDVVPVTTEETQEKVESAGADAPNPFAENQGLAPESPEPKTGAAPEGDESESVKTDARPKSAKTDAPPSEVEAEAVPTINMPGSCINCGQDGAPIEALSGGLAFMCPLCKHTWTPAEERAPFRQ